jgi:hypothetical protein
MNDELEGNRKEPYPDSWLVGKHIDVKCALLDLTALI